MASLLNQVLLLPLNLHLPLLCLILLLSPLIPLLLHLPFRLLLPLFIPLQACCLLRLFPPMLKHQPEKRPLRLSITDHHTSFLPLIQVTKHLLQLLPLFLLFLLVFRRNQFPVADHSYPDLLFRVLHNLLFLLPPLPIFLHRLLLNPLSLLGLPLCICMHLVVSANLLLLFFLLLVHLPPKHRANKPTK